MYYAKGLKEIADKFAEKSKRLVDDFSLAK